MQLAYTRKVFRLYQATWFVFAIMSIVLAIRLRLLRLEAKSWPYGLLSWWTGLSYLVTLWLISVFPDAYQTSYPFFEAVDVSLALLAAYAAFQRMCDMAPGIGRDRKYLLHGLAGLGLFVAFCLIAFCAKFWGTRESYALIGSGGAALVGFVLVGGAMVYLWVTQQVFPPNLTVHANSLTYYLLIIAVSRFVIDEVESAAHAGMICHKAFSAILFASWAYRLEREGDVRPHVQPVDLDTSYDLVRELRLILTASAKRSRRGRDSR